MIEDTEETWLTPSIAAQMLHVTPTTLRLMEADGTLSCPDRSPGGHRRYRLTEIEAVRDKRKAAS